jgi:energy-coupling factor transporter transmembrane protein EcfT
MTILKAMQNRIQGWFPRDPVIRVRTVGLQEKPRNNWSYLKNSVTMILVTLGVVVAVFVLSMSWIKIVVLSLAVGLGAAFILLHGKHRLRWAVGFGLVGVMVFALCFTAFEGYLSWNSGYPSTNSQSTPGITLSMTSLANFSVSKLVNGVMVSPTFSLLELEHGNLVFDSISLIPIGERGGYIEVNFFSPTDHTYFHFYSISGHPLIMQQMTYSGQRLAQLALTSEPVETTLNRIDELGLTSFYNQALQIAQNRTSNLLSVDSVSIAIAYARSTNIYGGLTVQLIGSHETPDPQRGTQGYGVLISEFQPDGTLIYMSKPTQEETE